VPPPFDEHATVEWTPVQSLSGGSPRYLPTMYLYFGYPASAADFFCPADSNGNACWSTLDGAVVQGLQELIERDSVALWWYNRVQRQAVDLDNANDPYCDDVRAYHAAQGRDLWALDLTSDLSVPCVAVISRSRTGSAERIVFGFGAHLDPVTALRRAMGEHDQMYAVHVGGGLGSGRSPNEVGRWLDHATVESHPYLMPAPGVSTLLEDALRSGSDHTDDELTVLLELLRECELDGFVLNQTRADVGIPVVKTIVPGLRHFWARFAAGRLYEVPLAMGWRSDAVPEAELNPVPLFI
jgi:ribosomal protein S12 methylthiotransferase accessory factor